MKKLLALSMCIALVLGVCPVTFAETVLSDEELGDLYAGRHGHGGIDIDINKVKELQDSAAVAQNNIGAMMIEGNSNDVSLDQSNAATVVANGTMDIDNSTNSEVNIDNSVTRTCKRDVEITNISTTKNSISDSYNQCMSNNTLDLEVSDSLNKTKTETTNTTTNYTTNTTTKKTKNITTNTDNSKVASHSFNDLTTKTNTTTTSTANTDNSQVASNSFNDTITKTDNSKVASNSFNDLTSTSAVNKTATLTKNVNSTDVEVGDVDLELGIDLNNAVGGSNIATGASEVANKGGNTGKSVVLVPEV